MLLPDKSKFKSLFVAAFALSLAVFVLLWTMQVPNRAAAQRLLQATATPVSTGTGTPNACGVVIATDFITPTAGVTSTVVVEPTPASSDVVTETAEVTPTGKVLRIGEDIYPAVLDPQRASFVNEFEVLSLAYEGLTSVDPAGNVQPAAATSYEFSQDGKTLTFTLRADLKRVDDTPITSKDFEDALERALDPCLGGRQYAASLFAIQGAQDISEFEVDTHTQQDLANAMDNLGIDSSDPTQLVLTFAEPVGDYWLYLASLPIFYPTDTSLVAKSPDGWSELAGSHNGNGPFFILSMDGEQKITLAANPNYWRGKPKVDRIEFKYNPDNQAQLDAYKNGELDIDASVTAELVPEIMSDTIASEFKKYDAAQTYALAFNNSVAPFNDRIVRTAFSQAVDREGFIRDVLLNGAKATTRWIPPGVPGSLPDEPGVPASDPAAAVKTLVDNGYGKDGNVDCDKLGPVTFTYADSPVNKQRAEYIASNLTQVLGCTIRTDGVNPTEFTRLTRDVKTNPQLSLQRWVEDYPSPQNWLSTYWTCGSFAKSFGYCNLFLDDLLKQADSTTDLEAAIKLYQEAEALLIQDVPGAFLYNPHNLQLVKPYVTGPAENTSPRDAGWIGEYGPVWQYDIDASAQTPSTPSATPSAASTPQAVTATQVTEYEPTALPPDPAYTGSCFTTSLTVQRGGAYRCSTDENVPSTGGANLFDPCFVVAGQTEFLACDPDPVQGTPGIKLQLTAALPAETPTPPTEGSAWMVELEDGTICGFATGATFGVKDMRANYACADQSWLFGDLKPGTVWTALQGTVTGNPPFSDFTTEKTVSLRKVWR